MRVSHGTKANIQSKILNDLYEKSEEELRNRRSNIAMQNRDYYLAPHEHLFLQLPAELLSHSKTYSVEIKYKQPTSDEDTDLEERWTYTSETMMINPRLYQSGLTHFASQNDLIAKLDSRLYSNAAILAEEIIALRKEKSDLTEFLISSFKEFSGPKQLRTVWPSSLHKYLPQTQATGPRKPKAPIEPTAIMPVPEGLNTRLATNLLEGD